MQQVDGPCEVIPDTFLLHTHRYNILPLSTSETIKIKTERKKNKQHSLNINLTPSRHPQNWRTRGPKKVNISFINLSSHQNPQIMKYVFFTVFRVGWLVLILLVYSHHCTAVTAILKLSFVNTATQYDGGIKGYGHMILLGRFSKDFLFSPPSLDPAWHSFTPTAGQNSYPREFLRRWRLAVWYPLRGSPDLC